MIKVRKHYCHISVGIFQNIAVGVFERKPVQQVRESVAAVHLLDLFREVVLILDSAVRTEGAVQRIHNLGRLVVILDFVIVEIKHAISH